MRVGIVSHWWGQSNYGQKLQAYALQRFLSEKGLEAYHIRYWFDSPFLKFYPVINSLINSFLHKKFIVMELLCYLAL